MESTTDDTATIFEKHSTTILEIRFQAKHNHFECNRITCWLPLKSSEPPNKKVKTGKELVLRARQASRGGYYQMNQGEDVHVHMYNSEFGKEPNDARWSYHYSHLCHHWWCCNPQHLRREPDWVNIFRKSDDMDDSGRSYSCQCPLLSHPMYNDGTIPKCIWYNSRAKNTLATKFEYPETDLLDVEFITNSASLQRLKAELRNDIITKIKELLK